jgi:mono/diheme cytochrome c family protein
MSARSVAWGGLLLLAILPSALGQQLGDPAAGERLAAANCAKCHSADGAAPAFTKIAAMPSTTQTSFGVFLQTSHASMPNLILTAADRNNLIAYILSLRP